MMMLFSKLIYSQNYIDWPASTRCCRVKSSVTFFDLFFSLLLLQIFSLICDVVFLPCRFLLATDNFNRGPVQFTDNFFRKILQKINRKMLKSNRKWIKSILLMFSLDYLDHENLVQVCVSVCRRTIKAWENYEYVFLQNSVRIPKRLKNVTVARYDKTQENHESSWRQKSASFCSWFRVRIHRKCKLVYQNQN